MGGPATSGRKFTLAYCTQHADPHCWLDRVDCRPIRGTRQIHVILYAKEPSFRTSTLRIDQGICAPRFGLWQGGGQSRRVVRGRCSASSCTRLMLVCVVYHQVWAIFRASRPVAPVDALIRSSSIGAAPPKSCPSV